MKLPLEKDKAPNLHSFAPRKEKKQYKKKFKKSPQILYARVDLHRPKMLIIQFHRLCLWKNASHTNLIHFCKMNLIEFQRYFIVVLVSKLVSLHEKKNEKNVFLKLPPKNFLRFFQSQTDFRIQTNIF